MSKIKWLGCDGCVYVCVLCEGTQCKVWVNAVRIKDWDFVSTRLYIT